MHKTKKLKSVFLTILSLLTVVSLQAHAEVVIDSTFLKTLNSTEQSKISSYLQEVLGELPKIITASFQNTSIKVNFTDMADEALIESEKLCLGQSSPDPTRTRLANQSYSLGQHQINLNRQFLKVILGQTPLSYSCQYKNFYTLAKATLAHELAHVYDEDTAYAQPVSDQVKKLCTNTNNNSNSQLCQFVRSIKTKISDRFPFRPNAGWSAFDDTHKNHSSRSVDFYERYNRRESFAVNFEHFLYDPEYRCRKPALFHIFSQNLGFGLPSTSKAVNCSTEFKVRDAISQLEMTVDLNRVQEVHYLLAAPGNDVSSAFGHAMLRLVICAPTTQPGPDCIRDIGHHIVVSYRAAVSDLRINNLAGLRGDYPSQLYFFNLSDIINEYTLGEDRALESIPIHLNRDQIKLLLAQVIEQSNSYVGKYYFLQNNCSTETQDLLAGVLNDPLLYSPDSSLLEFYVTPLVIKSRLTAGKYLDLNALKRDDAYQRYYFPPYTTTILSAFNKFRNKPGYSGPQSPEDLWKALSSQERRRIFVQMFQNTKTKPERLQLFAFWSAIEQLVKTYGKIKVREELSQLLDEFQTDTSQLAQDTQKLIEDIRAASRDLQNSIQPPIGYGIALEQDQLPNSEVQAKLNRFNELNLVGLEHFKKLKIGAFNIEEQAKENILFYDKLTKGEATSVD